MKKVFIVMLVLVGIAVGVAALQQYLQPKITKVEYQLQDSKTFLDEFGVDVSKSEISSLVAPKDSVKNEGTKEIKTEIDSKEATALANLWSDSWNYAPLTNSNIEILDDTRILYSGTVDLNRALGFAAFTGVPQNVVDLVKKYTQPFGNKFPIFIEGTIHVEDNVVNIDFLSARVSFVPVTYIVRKYSNEINSYLTSVISSDSNYKVKSVTVKDGKLKIEGVFPEKVEYINGK